MCKKCNDDRCTGFYLLHPKELDKIPEIEKKELEENPNVIFILIDSPSSREIFTKFKELHVIDMTDSKERVNCKYRNPYTGYCLYGGMTNKLCTEISSIECNFIRNASKGV